MPFKLLSLRQPFSLPVLAACMLAAGGMAAKAQPAPPGIAPSAPRAAPQDDRLILQPRPQLQQPRPAIGSPSAGQGQQPAQKLPELSDQDLQRNRPLAEHVINQAMLREDWKTLERVMAFYPQMPGADPMLVDYVQGALARRAGRHGEAIARYRRMLAADPTLSYVRLDLAGMLSEDKQYKGAERELDAVLRDLRLAPAARASAMQYRQALARQQGWHGSLALGWGWNSNVNQGTDNEVLYLPVGVTENNVLVLFELPKDAKDRPHSAHGPRLEAIASRDFNLGGHHNLTLGGGVDGASYLALHDFNRVTANVRAGYKWQNLSSWLNVTPLASRMWQGGKGYSRGSGISADYGRWLGGSWQASGSFLWLARRYDDSRYADYEGHIRGATLSLTKIVSPNLALFGGLSLQDEQARDAENSSLRRNAQIGGLYSLANGLSTRASARYTHRKFDAPYSLFLWQERRDREYALDASAWNRHWQVAGFTPKLNVSYLRVKSTLYAYPRTEKEISLMLEKTF